VVPGGPYLLPAVTASVPLPSSTNAPHGSFDFGNDGYPGELLILTTTHSPKTGNPVPQSARRRDDAAELIALYKRRAELIAQIARSEAALPNR
jgi:hypothetical protein